MTAVGYTQRGEAPQHYSPSFALSRGSAKAPAPHFSGAEHLAHPIARAAQQQTWAKLSLGGRLLNRFTDMTVPLFQRITEVYIIGFIMQDVIGMWVPRIGTSLKVGRVPYDPTQDPEAKDKPFKEQLALWVKGNIKGLNWGNFQEETAREAATGPGLLVIPSIMYAFASRAMSRSGIHLRYDALNGFCNGFQDYLRSSNLNQAGSELKLSEYRQAMGQYVSSIFNDSDLRNTRMPEGGTYGEFLDQWGQRWARAMEMGTDKASRKKQAAALSSLGQELQEKLTAFNQEHRMRAYKINGKTIGATVNDSLLHRADYAWISYSGKGELSHVSLKQLVGDLTKWTDVSRAIYKAQTEKLAGVANAKLPDVVDFVRRKVVSHKALFAVSTSLLGMAYLYKLVFWTQRHNSYQATRLLHTDKVQLSGQTSGSGQTQGSPYTPPRYPFSMEPRQTVGMAQGGR
ncbi:MAG TPA: hypothetical protein V6C99_06225 [Oculatellaceae cyanobacterium]|jgi:hypothetical protein